MKQTSFLFSGFGGQGVMFVGQLLAYAAMDAGLEVTWIPSYGPEMRGGTAHCTIIMADKPIGAPVVARPDVAVVFNNPSFDKYEPLVEPDGLLAVNSSMVERESTRQDITTLYVPASDMADKLGQIRLANIVLLGAALSSYPALSLDALRAALEAHIPEHRRNLLPLNYEAIDLGAAFVKEGTSA